MQISYADLQYKIKRFSNFYNVFFTSELGSEESVFSVIFTPIVYGFEDKTKQRV